MGKVGNWGKLDTKRGEITQSITVVLEDAFEYKDMRFEVQYTSNMYLGMWLQTENPDFESAPKRKIIKFRMAPSFSKIWSKVDHYFPNLMTIEEGDRFSIDGDEDFVSSAKSCLVRNLDKEWFENNRNNIKKSRTKILKTKNDQFKLEWNLEANYVLFCNGVEHFVFANSDGWGWVSKEQVINYFKNPIFEFSQNIYGDSLKIIFSQPYEKMGYAYIERSGLRQYFWFQGHVSANLFFLTARTLKNLISASYGQIIKELLSVGGEKVSFNSSDTRLSFELPPNALPLLAQLSSLPDNFISIHQAGLNKVQVMDENRRVRATIKPIHASGDGSYDWGGWSVRQRAEDGSYFRFESKTAIEGVLRVVGNSNFTLVYRSINTNGEPVSQNEFFGPGISLVHFDDSWTSDTPPYFNVKSIYVNNKQGM